MCMPQVWVVAGGDRGCHNCIAKVCKGGEAANRVCERYNRREPELTWIVQHLIVDA